MKNIKMITTLMLLAGVVLLFSCKKSDDATPSSSSTSGGTGTAIITGNVKAELDLTEAILEFAPAGTKIIAWINTEDLLLNPDTGTYPNRFYEVTVNSDGSYRLEVDADSKAVTVHVAPDDFLYNQVISRDTVAGTDSTERQIYHCNSFDVVIHNSQTRIFDIQYQVAK